MTPTKRIPKATRENERLRQRLEQAEQVIQGIRSGAVDALIVDDGTARVYTLEGAERPYRVLVEAMREGALILMADGSILYCNSGFARMVKAEGGRIIARPLDAFATRADRDRLKKLVKEGRRKSRTEEMKLKAADGTVFPVLLSLVPLGAPGPAAVCVVVTDLTEAMATRERRIRHSEELLEAHKQERRLIARELHDSTAQSLATIAFSLEMELQSPDFDEGTRKRLESVLALAKESADEIRDFSHLLHPPHLDTGGLSAAIRMCVARFTEMTGIPVELEIARELDELPEDMDQALLRVVQESLNNVFRHSKSPVAKVELRREAEGVVLQIADQGLGMAPGPGEAAGLPPGDRERGIGIASMRERVESIGGRFEIESGENGTIVRATCPEREQRMGRKAQRAVAWNANSRAS